MLLESLVLLEMAFAYTLSLIHICLERIVNYLKNLHFSESDIAYLESLGYEGAFLDYLKNFKMELTVRSAKEGDLVLSLIHIWNEIKGK